MSQKRIIIYGGNGALGRVCISVFKSKNYLVSSIDLKANDEADANILVENCNDWTLQEEQVSKGISANLGSHKVDAIICVAGGWAGGNAADKDMVKNADLMWKQSVWSSAIAARLAAQHLSEGGILVLTGAQPALKGTSGMMGYGMAKAAIHQLTKSLACESSGLPKDAFAAAILPITLDTPMNRKFMPNADHSKWTPLPVVAELFDNWMNARERPANGSLVQLVTKDGKTEFVLE